MISLLVRTLLGEKTERAPFWFMRQAGRYLPEYKEVRATTKNFLEFCYNPDKAAKVTLQPIERFNMDAAIIFSDILVIPDALGQKVEFLVGEGPKLEPIENEAAIEKLTFEIFDSHLAPVYAALKKVRSELAEEKALIGFAGAPWTLACYMLEGGGAKDFARARQFAASQPEAFDRLMDIVTEAIIRHLRNQADSGANVLQIFDSWAGAASAMQFQKYTITPAKKISAALNMSHPHIPLIGFPRGAGINYVNYAKEAGMQGVSLDYGVPIDWVAETLSPHTVIQGNLDPLLLAGNGEEAVKQARHIIETMRGRNFIFNLGHGIVPHTPIQHVKMLSDYLLSV